MATNLRLKSLFTDAVAYMAQQKQFPILNEENQFLKAIQFLESHFTENISIADLSRSHSIAPSYFNVKFKWLYSITPVEFVNQKRIALDRKILESSKISLKEVALQTGFEDYFCFSRVFKKYAQLSPLQYRKIGKFKHIHSESALAS